MSAGITPAVERVTDVLIEHRDIVCVTGDPDVVARDILDHALSVEEMTRVQIAHDRRIWSSGEVECACGEWQVTRDAEGYKRSTNEFRGGAVRAHMEHVSTALRTALLGADS